MPVDDAAFRALVPAEAGTLTILSIDVASRTLGLCLMSVKVGALLEGVDVEAAPLPLRSMEPTIHKWSVVDVVGDAIENINKARTEELIPCFHRYLSAHGASWLEPRPDVIAIECQPLIVANHKSQGIKGSHMGNVKTFVFSHILAYHLHGTCPSAPTFFISPSRKIGGLSQGSYTKNKEFAVLLARTLLGRASLSRWHDDFLATKKKDDLADCLIQGLCVAAEYFAVTGKKRKGGRAVLEAIDAAGVTAVTAPEPDDDVPLAGAGGLKERVEYLPSSLPPPKKKVAKPKPKRGLNTDACAQLDDALAFGGAEEVAVKPPRKKKRVVETEDGVLD
jgi:hypothetical protein